MKKIFTIVILNLFIFVSVFATHNRAGEITYRQISAYTFEFTVTTFTYTLSLADRPTLNVQWGDNTVSVAPRVSAINLPDFYRKNTYIIRHTFPGPGVYEIVMQDPNRNLGVLNIPGSVNVVFAVKTTMIVNPQLGTNNTPILLNNPIDKAALGKIFIHNPAAYDPDGDSLSYEITTCLKEKGEPISNYSLPRASNPLHPVPYVNAITGDLIWDAPMDTGIFNFAMNIEEWRKGVKIGNIVRDMQVEVYNTKNNPPVNQPLTNICVEAGKLIDFTIESTDVDKDSITQTATGGPFVVDANKATFTVVSKDTGRSVSRFTWQTDCSHARKQPYIVVIKAEDNNKEVKLVDIDNFTINVIAPAPKNLVATAKMNSVSLTWDKSACTNATGYTIYRSTLENPFTIDSCKGGLPASSGYVAIGSVNSVNTTTFEDDNNGQSLSPGINYCYRIVAKFVDGSESYPSDEACATLIPGLPALTSASVTKVDPANGEVFVSWLKPIDFDTTTIKGPYEYRFYRSDDLAGKNLSLIGKRPSIDLTDTTFTDTGLNTVTYPYSYRVELYNVAPGDTFLIGTPETASTMYPVFASGDNQLTLRFKRIVPWMNNQYIIYRQNQATSTFDSIGFTNTEEYIDTGLANNQTYYYQVKAYGLRLSKGVYYNTVNISHIAGGTPVDTVPPCPPQLTVNSVCDSSVNLLTWTNPNHYCSDDAVKYNIYYRPGLTGDFSLVGTIDNVYDTTYRHTPDGTLAGCYVVTAIDSFSNESSKESRTCVDVCSGYKLPNVFTPNGDDLNDIYKSYNPNHYVKKVGMKIYNRWGVLVFSTEDADINWDGREMKTKLIVPTGVYYYICDVYEPRLTGVEVRAISGFINVYTGKNDKPFVQ